jgi:hypothetical protein
MKKKMEVYAWRVDRVDREDEWPDPILGMPILIYKPRWTTTYVDRRGLHCVNGNQTRHMTVIDPPPGMTFEITGPYACDITHSNPRPNHIVKMAGLI